MNGGGDMTTDVVRVDPPRSIVVACVMWRRHHTHVRAGVRIIRVFATRLHVRGSSDIGFWIAPNNAAACMVVTRVSQLVSEHARVRISAIDDDEYVCARDALRARQPRLNNLARSASHYILCAHYLRRVLAVADLPISGPVPYHHEPTLYSSRTGRCLSMSLSAACRHCGEKSPGRQLHAVTYYVGVELAAVTSAFEIERCALMTFQSTQASSEHIQASELCGFQHLLRLRRVHHAEQPVVEELAAAFRRVTAQWESLAAGDEALAATLRRRCGLGQHEAMHWLLPSLERVTRQYERDILETTE